MQRKVFARNVKADHQQIRTRGRLGQVYNLADVFGVHRRAAQQKARLRERTARLVHGNRSEVGACRHGGDRHILPEVEMRAVRLVREHLHTGRVRELDNFSDVRADAVVGRVVDEHRLRGRVLLDGGLDVRDRHAERNAQPVVHLRIDIDRYRAGEHERVDDAAVHVARENDLVAALHDREYHRLHAARRAADHEEGVRRAERIGRQLLRLADDARRVAQVVERLHRVDVHGHALLTEERRQLGRAASALVAGNVERHNAHILEVFERLHDGRAGLIHRNAFFRQKLGFSKCFCPKRSRSSHGGGQSGS